MWVCVNVSVCQCMCVWLACCCYTPVTKLGGLCRNHYVGLSVMCLALSRRHLLNRSTFCHRTWYGGASLWGMVSCKDVGCYLQGEGHNGRLYNQNMTFNYIFWTNDPVATKRSLVVAGHKPIYPVKILDCYVQGHGHGKHLECILMFEYLLNC